MRDGSWPSGATLAVGVIGSPIRHSLSPAIFNTAFAVVGLDWVMIAFEVPAGQAADAIAAGRVLGLRGTSVTMPLKQEVAAAVDRLTPAAERLGAVNSVRFDGPRATGDNTDGAGFVAALELEHGFDPDGASCVVAGAGGAARAIVAALSDAGAREVVVLARSPDKAAALLALARPGVVRVAAAATAAAETDAAALVVNATPVGMRAAGRQDERGPFDGAELGAGQLVVDIVYDPLETPLLRRARASGAATEGGLSMLVHQAVRQFELWTGEPAPVSAMWDAARAGIVAVAPDGLPVVAPDGLPVAQVAIHGASPPPSPAGRSE